MRRLYFGGSFNPVHHGHLICARAVAEAAGYERVVLMPSAQPPHKPITPEIAPPADRLEMCRLAAAMEPEMFEVDDLEVRRPGQSYTIDTVRALKARGEAEVNWLIGADMLNILPQWREAEALLRETRFAIMARPGWEFEWQTLPPAYRTLPSSVVTAPLIDISATDIRRRIAAGRAVEYLMPAEVVRYIRQRGLYEASTGG